MNRVKNVLSSLTLLVFAFMLFLSILFYHVSAVVVYGQHKQKDFIRIAEGLHSLANCSWESEVLIKEKVITLKCFTFTATEVYVSFGEKVNILAKIDSSNVNFDTVRNAFRSSTNENTFKLSLTSFDGKGTYWITTKNKEWLLDMNDYSILWKVEKSNE